MSTRLTHAERRGKKPWKYYLSMEQILARRQIELDHEQTELFKNEEGEGTNESN